MLKRQHLERLQKTDCLNSCKKSIQEVGKKWKGNKSMWEREKEGESTREKIIDHGDA